MQKFNKQKYTDFLRETRA
jgi:hypothetical protein